MKDACKSFGGGTLKKGVAKGLPSGFAFPPEIRRLATTFVDLQDGRHLADYDLTERFKRSDVLTLVEQVKQNIQDFTKSLRPACFGPSGRASLPSPRIKADNSLSGSHR